MLPSSNEPIVVSAAEMPQRSEEWFKERRGRPSSSHFDDIISGTTWKWNTQSAHIYMCRLVAESLLNRSLDSDLSNNTSVRYGVEHEDEARSGFSNTFNIEIEQVGLVLRQDRKVVCSPDGLFSDRKGILEIKCPEPWTQISNTIVPRLRVESGDVGTAYMPQLQGQLMICDAEVLHFWSWRHDLPPVRHIIERNDRLIRILHEAVDEFCHRLDKAKAQALDAINAA